MRTTRIILVYAILFFTACQYKLPPFKTSEEQHQIKIARFDRLQSRYLTTGDFVALQTMETDYPMETRALIENILKLGPIDDAEINQKFLSFYQDSTLQVIISDAESAYADMSDLNASLNDAFKKLRQVIPNIRIPTIYAQIGALDQSVIINDQTIGISLDKYLGEFYPLYLKFGYNEQQRKQMTRQNIVPDCISFYLISLYPIPDFESRSQFERDIHMGKMMWISNYALGSKFFNNQYINKIDHYMRRNPKISISQLLKMTNYSVLQ